MSSRYFFISVKNIIITDVPGSPLKSITIPGLHTPYFHSSWLIKNYYLLFIFILLYFTFSFSWSTLLSEPLERLQLETDQTIVQRSGTSAQRIVYEKQNGIFLDSESERVEHLFSSYIGYMCFFYKFLSSWLNLRFPCPTFESSTDTAGPLILQHCVHNTWFFLICTMQFLFQ